MTVRLASPLAGWITALADIPDPVFAERMLGDGIAIDPVEGRLAAPADGVIVSVHPSGHAVTLETDGGAVLLMHIGLDTVGLGGEGFTPRVADGARVRAGDPLIDFDLDRLARTARSLITPLIVTNGDAFALVSPPSPRAIAIGDPLIELRALAATRAEAPVHAGAAVERSVLLPLAHGLHARPAARVAALAAGFDAAVALVAADGRTAPANSAVAMLALALAHGAQLTVRATGAQADAAAAAIADLLDSGMDELRPIAPSPMPPPAPVTVPARLVGVAAVPGLAIGPAFVWRAAAIDVPEFAADPLAERQALDEARSMIRAALAAEASDDGPQAAIAAAHLAFVDDSALTEAADRTIGEGKSAGFAWRQAIEGFVAPLRSAGNPRFAERIDDLRDIERRVIEALIGADAAPPTPPTGAILIAHDLFPSHLMALADAGLAGIATATGGATSHVAIIAAGMGVPMAAALGPALALIEDGTELILRDATLEIAPSAERLRNARGVAAARAASRQAAQAHAHEPARTVDGVRIEVFANLGSIADARAAVREGAEGCGLLRTEFLFLDRAAPPDEAEQRAAYQAIADALGDRPLIVRTLDIGADKPASWLPMAMEENPALGVRGIRLQLARPDLLDTQFRALLGVKAAALKVMLPMVADVSELDAAHARLDRLARDIGVAPPALGIMVETPAAALIAAQLARRAAFFSIGSNDLGQYALARDRTNPALAAGLDGLHPAILRLIDETVRGGAAQQRWTGVCGGLAAVPAAVPLLIGLGVSELSVPAAAIAETKALVRGLDRAACRTLAARALAAPDAAAVRALTRPFVEQAA